MSDTYAVLMLGHIPDKLFEDVDEAQEYVETHERLDDEKATICWPIRVHGDGDE